MWDLSPAPEVSVPGADEFSATVVLATGPGLLTELLTIYARAGDVSVLSTGSHRDTVEYNAQLMVARITGGPEPTKVEPEDAGSSAFGTDSVSRFRSLAAEEGTVPPAVARWAEDHDDAEINTVFDRICSGMRSAQTQVGLVTEINKIFDELDTELRGDLTADDFFGLAGAGIVFYCPDQAERLGLIPD